MKKVTPIRFEGFMQSGGSTKPWQVTAVDENSVTMEEVSYVVKVFKTKHIEEGFSIAKEFICNALAKEFELTVPEACLIDINESNFRETLPKDALTILDKKYKGSTFASKLINGSILNEQVKYSSFDIHDCALLFAFDCMIINTDRGGFRDKPNLLVDDEGFILIDHELTLYFIDKNNDKSVDDIIGNLSSNNWPFSYEKHIFYGHLKAHKGSKKNLFDTFE